MDKALRNTLRNVVTQCRKELEKAVAEMLEGQFGIYASGKIDDATAMSHLSAEDQEYRSQLLVHLEHIQAGGFKAKDAAEQLIREVAFTHLNRFCAYKMMEVRKLIRESVSRGYASNNVKFYLADHPEDERLYNSGQQAIAYRHFLEWLGGTLSEEIGVLFSPHDPANRLLPPQRVLDQVLELLNSEALKDIWAEDETIGWIYQYFTPKELRDQARKESQAPRNSYELAFRNQFYTPSYVVQFLTDNTLGRIWYEMRQGETALKALCQYMVCRPNEVFLAEGEAPPEETQADESLSQEELLQQPVYIAYRKLKDPREIRVLDPACGSGHFLLYCFTLLLIMYEEAWDACPAVLCDLRDSGGNKEAFMQQVPGLILAHNLHGIDIDIRATQIAALALWLRAQRTYQEMGLKKNRPKITKLSIVCAEPMPGNKVLLEEFILELQPKVLGQLTQVVFNKMKLAGESGSLLKIEEEIRDVIIEAKRQWKAQPKVEQLALLPDFQSYKPEQLTLFDVSEITDETFWHGVEFRLIEALRDYAERTAGDQKLQRQLFADDAVQGFSFIDICRQKFDIVLMNPPFGDSIPSMKDFLIQHYAHAKQDLGMCFVSRGSSLLNSNGFIGAITSRNFLSNGYLTNWRYHQLLSHKFGVTELADLGFNVLDEAKVEAAAFILQYRSISTPIVFYNILNASNKEDALLQSVQELTKNGTDERISFRQTRSFLKIPDYIICYWLPGILLNACQTLPNLEKINSRARVGLQTGDNDRFVRTIWEVPSRTIGIEKKWSFFAKGGEYEPFYDDIHLVVLWESNGEEIKNFKDKNGKIVSMIKNPKFYYKEGITYPDRTTSDFSPRVMPKGVIFSSTGFAIFPSNRDDCLGYLGAAYTRIFKIIIEAFVSSGDSSTSSSMARHYRPGLLNILPNFLLNPEAPVRDVALECLLIRIRAFSGDETARYYIGFNVNNADKSLKDKAVKFYLEYVKDVSTIVEKNLFLEQKVIEKINLISKNEDDKSCFRSLLDELWGCHPAQYSNEFPLDELEDRINSLLSLTEDKLVEEALSCLGARRQIVHKSYFGDRQLELIAHILKISIQALHEFIKLKTILPPKVPIELAQHLVSYSLGSVFGRWDIRLAKDKSLLPEFIDPFNHLPICSPATLIDISGFPAVTDSIVSEEWLSIRPDMNAVSPTDKVKNPVVLDSAYPIKIDWDGILVDDSDHPDDILRRIRDVLEVLWGDRAENIEQEACEILGVKDLRDYFRKPGNGGFWQDHIKRYSKSRRKAPIYWLLQSSKKSYALWLYYHRLDKDILFKAHTQYVEPKLNLETDKLNQLNNQRATLSGTALKQLERDIEKQESLVSELTDFSDKLQRAAKLDFGRNLNQDVVFDPDLNDGVVLNIAPLWELTPWSEAKKYWQDLIQGKYEWSSIGKQLRAKGIVQC